MVKVQHIPNLVLSFPANGCLVALWIIPSKSLAVPLGVGISVALRDIALSIFVGIKFLAYRKRRHAILCQQLPPFRSG